ncbi:hypothetical protein FACS18947_6410 [Bacteroidia bacterium]|nr:hypothetical protein FACS18947_6410 [Bacteroidia bacterium]
MSKKKLTPIELLYNQKMDLEVKALFLKGSLHNDIGYLQSNIVPLVSDCIKDATVSNMPVFVQDWVSRKREEKSESSDYAPFVLGVVKSALSIIPLFVKGKKGVILSLILNQIGKFL